MKRLEIVLAAILAGGLCMSAGAQSMSNQGMSDQGMSGQSMSNKGMASGSMGKKHAKSMHMRSSHEMMGTVMSMDKKTGMVTMKMKSKSSMSGMKEGDTMMMKESSH